MREELDKALCEKYPKIFAERNLSMQMTCMCWGFDHGDGWYTLLDTMCKQLQWDTDMNGSPQVVAMQVKEKYGTLHFYFKGGDDRAEGVIRMAEAMSAHICEECGMPGKIRTAGWLRTLCDKCTPS